MGKLMILGSALMIPIAGVAAAAAWRRGHSNGHFDDEVDSARTDDPRFAYETYDCSPASRH